MSARIQKRFVYEGFGFPVLLLNAPMVKVRGVWTPDLNYNELAQGILETMAVHPARLSGSEIRFVRLYFEKTLKKFAERFGVTHPAVKKWEQTKLKPAKMGWSTEKDVRLFILESLGKRPVCLGEVSKPLYHLFLRLGFAPACLQNFDYRVLQ